LTHLIGRLQVKDFETWQRVFAAGRAQRRSMGALREDVFVELGDHTRVVLVARWQDVAAAMRFIATPEFTRAMKEAGVIGPLDFTFAKQTNG
jgi:quinol monooxygenase YgiN